MRPPGAAMGAKDLIDKGPVGSRSRGLHRPSLWWAEFVPAETRQALPVVLPVAAVGAAATLAAIFELVGNRPSGSTIAALAALLLASLLAEAFPLPIEGVTVSTTSLAIVFIVATAEIYGWPEAAVI